MGGNIHPRKNFNMEPKIIQFKRESMHFFGSILIFRGVNKWHGVVLVASIILHGGLH